MRIYIAMMKIAKAPVFMTEWGYTYSTTGTNVDDTSSSSWGQTFQTFVEGAGASWTAWVTDNSWTPSLFTDANLTQLSTFGTLVQAWLAADASTDWVQ
jgi:hypothetical protein